MNKQTTGLLQKEMSRKEFLSASGLAVASVLGFGGIVKLLFGSHEGTGSGRNIAGGFGSGVYGGGKE